MPQKPASKKAELGSYSIAPLVKPMAQQIANKTYDEEAAYYEPLVKQVSGFYYYLYVRNDKGLNSISQDDLAQACRMALYNIGAKRKEMLNIYNYVKAAMKYAIFGEIKKMKQKLGKTYFAEQDDELVPLVDVLPTKENIRGQRDDIDELLYNIKHEFSPKEADNLKALIDKCDEAHLLNLSKPPVTDKKEQLKLVTAMDLSDVDMLLYAQVLLGGNFRDSRNKVLTPEKGAKYITFVLQQLGITNEQFAIEHKNRKEILNRYRLNALMDGHKNRKGVYDGIAEMFEYIAPDVDAYKVRATRTLRNKYSLTDKDFLDAWNAIEWVRRRNHTTPDKLKRYQMEKVISGLIRNLFHNSSGLAIEFRYPGTYPEYAEEAMKLREQLAEYIKNPGKM